MSKEPSAISERQHLPEEIPVAPAPTLSQGFGGEGLAMQYLRAPSYGRLEYVVFNIHRVSVRRMLKSMMFNGDFSRASTSNQPRQIVVTASLTSKDMVICVTGD